MVESTVSDLVSALSTFIGGLGGTILVLLPGYIIGAIFSRGIRGPAVAEKVFIAVSALGGLIVHLVALPWTDHLAHEIARGGVDAHIEQIAAWSFVVLIAVPALIGVGLAHASEATGPRWLVAALREIGLTASVRTAEAWNWVFRKQATGVWVRVHLKDENGKSVLGKFSTESFASSDATLRDIYLEELWLPDDDGWFQAAYGNTQGVWISGDQIASIEFFEGSE